MKHGITPEGVEGEVETYEGQVVIEVPILASKDGITELSYVATGQGCAEIFGICYRPLNIEQSAIGTQAFTVSDQAVAATTSTPPVEAQTETAEEEFVSEQDKSAAVLASGDALAIIIYFFLGGFVHFDVELGIVEVAADF